jgi:hypothetical protein
MTSGVGISKWVVVGIRVAIPTLGIRRIRH